MRVAVIDDGIAENSISLPLISYRIINHKVTYVDKNITSEHSHGTHCAKIIFKNITGVEVISIAVYPEYGDGSVADLLIALEWCIDNDIDVINLSNGFGGYFNNLEIAKICNKLWSRGVNIVAAINNSGEYTLPANLPYVIGVAKHKLFRGKAYRVQPDISASGLYLYRNRRGKLCVDCQNSFACAQVCNRIIKKLKKKKNNIFNVRCSFKEIYDFTLLANILATDDCNQKEKSVCQSINEQEKLTFLVKDTRLVTENKELLQSQPNIGLLIWCDTRLPFFVRKYCSKNNIFYWYESKSRMFLKKHKKTKHNCNNAYLISFNDCDKSFQKAIDLKLRFENNGYSVVVFSSRKQCYLSGAIYLKDISGINAWCLEYNPDIAIVIDDCSDFLWDAKIHCDNNIILRFADSPANQYKCVNSNDIYLEIINNVAEGEAEHND